jgi:VWFA-related protein
MTPAKFACLFGCLVWTGSLHAQVEASPRDADPVLHVSSNLVVVDIVVTDAHGQPVKGLKESDFSISEKNMAQKITSFEEHAETDPSSVRPLPKLPPGVFTNYIPAPRGAAVNVLLLDALNTPIADQVVVRDQLLDYLKHAKPGPQIAIFGLSDRLTMLQAFTSDPEALKRAITQKKSSPSVLLEDTGPSQAPDALDSQTGNASVNANMAYNIASFKAQIRSSQLELRIQTTFDALDELARYLADVPGRKNLIWFSGSFPINILPDPDAENRKFMQLIGQFSLENELRETSTLLGHSQVAVYPIDARGLISSPISSAEISGGKLKKPGTYAAAESKFSSNTFNEHGTMDDMAQATGGQAFVDTNGLAHAVASAIDAGASYYTLTYVPAAISKPGEYRSIQLELTKTTPKYTLAYRRGYFRDDPTAKIENDTARTSASQNALRIAMLHGGPALTQILYKVAVIPASSEAESSALPHNAPSQKAKGPWKRYLVQFAADSHELTRVNLPDGKIHLSVALITVVYDLQGNILNSASNTIGANVTEAEYEGLRKTGIQYRQQISVPTGAYSIRTVVDDQLGSQLGAVEIPLTAIQNLPSLNLPPPSDTK